MSGQFLNLIFGLTTSLVPIALIWGLCRLGLWWGKKKFAGKTEMPTAAVDGCAIFLACAIIFSNVGTYGPRVTTDSHTIIPAPPAKVAVEEREDLFAKSRDRFGEADRRINEEPVE